MFFCFKQKTAYEMRISDWSSDVCSSDLPDRDLTKYAKVLPTANDDVLSVEVKDPKRPEYGTITMVFVRDSAAPGGLRLRGWVALDSQNNRTRLDLSNQKFNVAEIGRASYRGRVCQYV